MIEWEDRTAEDQERLLAHLRGERVDGKVEWIPLVLSVGWFLTQVWFTFAR